MTTGKHTIPDGTRRHWNWWQKFAAGAVGLFFAFIALGFSLNAAGYHAPPRPVHVTTQQFKTPAYVPDHAPGADNLMAISDKLAVDMLSVHYPTGPMRPWYWDGSGYAPATFVHGGVQYYAGPVEWQWIIASNGGR